MSNSLKSMRNDLPWAKGIFHPVNKFNTGARDITTYQSLSWVEFKWNK